MSVEAGPAVTHTGRCRAGPISLPPRLSTGEGATQRRACANRPGPPFHSCTAPSIAVCPQPLRGPCSQWSPQPAWSMGGSSSSAAGTCRISVYCRFSRRVIFWSPRSPEPPPEATRCSASALAALAMDPTRSWPTHSSSRLSTETRAGRARVRARVAKGGASKASEDAGCRPAC